MKKFLYPVSAALVILVLLTPCMADTIRLKDGSVIRGRVIGFKEQLFTILIGAGAKGRRSQTTVYVEDIESIEFDSAGGTTTQNSESTSTSQESSSVVDSQPRPTSRTDTSGNTRRTNSSAGMGAANFFTVKVAVRADAANNGWSNTGLVVRKGQRLRINSSGRVSLGNGRYSTPVGLSTIRDDEKLMRAEATGGLIAVIGDDNDDFIFIGSQREFVSQRDGVLFLGINEGNLTDNSGSYDTVIEAEAGGISSR